MWNSNLISCNKTKTNFPRNQNHKTMRNLTPQEMFDNGFKAMELKDYANAEQWFLSVLYKYSKSQDSTIYVYALNSINYLSRIYSQGQTQDKTRAQAFLKKISESDTVVISEYSYALINGVYESPNYLEAIRQVSKLDYEEQFHFLSHFYHNGFGVEKNEEKATLLLTVLSNKSNGNSSDLYLKARNTVDELYKNNDFKLERDKNNTTTLAEFFDNMDFIPTISILIDEPLKVIVEDNEIAYQMKNLKAIYKTANFAPVFKKNPKYCINDYAALTPYIAYDDIMHNRYIIRGRLNGEFSSFDNEKSEIIAKYSNIDELVNDGWQLD